MLAVYIVTAILGGGIALVSLVLGGHGHEGGVDAGHDFDHGVDHHVEHDAGHGDGEGVGSWLPYLSLRFWMNLLFGFGLTGILLTFFANTPEPTAALVSGAVGIVAGFALSALYRVARKLETTTGDPHKIEGRVGTVTVPIRPGQTGKIRLEFEGESIDYFALSETPETLEPGDKVVVLQLDNDKVLVMRENAILDS